MLSVFLKRPEASFGKEIVSQHPDNDNYGINRIVTSLKYDGIEVSRRTVYRAMKEAMILIFTYYNRLRIYNENTMALPPVKYR